MKSWTLQYSGFSPVNFVALQTTELVSQVMNLQTTPKENITLGVFITGITYGLHGHIWWALSPVWSATRLNAECLTHRDPEINITTETTDKNYIILDHKTITGDQLGSQYT
jgi:hypothetical protein